MNGIDFVLLADVAELAKMVHMDEVFSYLTVAFAETNITDHAVISVELKASGSGDWVPFVGVDQYLPDSAFDKGAFGTCLLCNPFTTLAETACFQCGSDFGS